MDSNNCEKVYVMVITLLVYILAAVKGKVVNQIHSICYL